MTWTGTINDFHALHIELSFYTMVHFKVDVKTPYSTPDTAVILKRTTTRTYITLAIPMCDNTMSFIEDMLSGITVRDLTQVNSKLWAQYKRATLAKVRDALTDYKRVKFRRTYKNALGSVMISHITKGVMDGLIKRHNTKTEQVTND